MKNIITTLLVTFTSATAFAHSGSHHVSCHSTGASKQNIVFSLTRSNGEGFGDQISVSVKGKKTEINGIENEEQYGATIRNPALGVIAVTATNVGHSEDPAILYLSLMAVPSSVKAYDDNGQRVRWSLERENDSCIDANGRAEFQGVFRGSISTKKSDGSYEYQPIGAEILDCEMDYSSGMAC